MSIISRLLLRASRAIHEINCELFWKFDCNFINDLLYSLADFLDKLNQYVFQGSVKN